MSTSDPNLFNEAPLRAVCHGGETSPKTRSRPGFIDASASINPLGLPAWLREVVESHIEDLVHYPEPHARELALGIALQHQVPSGSVAVGNGTSELLSWLPAVLLHLPWLVLVPSYSEYRRAPELFGVPVRTLELGPAPEFSLDGEALERNLQRPHVVVLGHPNNPTGKVLDLGWLASLRQRHSDSWFVVDEAFADLVDGFVGAFDCRAPNLVVLRSLTKSLAIPGLRLGYALGPEPLIGTLRERLPPWSVNTLAAQVGLRALTDTGFLNESRRVLGAWRTELIRGLMTLPNTRSVPSAANWVLLELRHPSAVAEQIASRARVMGVHLRCCANFPGLSGEWLRIAVRTPEENDRIVAVLRECLGVSSTNTRATPRSRALMVQGCSSDAGKSLMVAALLRCLSDDGVDVVPFKAQNMSNNAGVAFDGGEIGRAQILQAHAARVAPDSRMNPVLLKPCSEQRCQVILDGKPFGFADAQSYSELRKLCLESATRAFDSLAREHAVVICEGAGSSGELNLRDRDVVNMGFVDQREMPVLLVGDIERGGVYASFVGHMAVLSERDRHRIKGFIVNRFRGDRSLLAAAHTRVLSHVRRPVLGVIPFLDDLRLPAEDRLALSAGAQCFGSPNAPIQIAVVVPPHVANSTDLEPLAYEPDVCVRLVERATELGDPTVVLLLGTKSTVSDLIAFRERGLAEAIVAAAARGVEVVGLCGGLQMLGEHIVDRWSVESATEVVEGLGLLPMVTEFCQDKLVRHTQAEHLPSKLAVHGFEIHHGKSDFSRVKAAFVARSGEVIGVCHPNARIWGTYLHGVFDSDAFRHYFLDQLRDRLGLRPLGSARATFGVEKSIGRIARTFRAHTDYEAIRRLILE
jgi:adenosylcobyric acid synthase